MGKEPSIKRVWSFLEIVISATLLVAGLFLLQEGIANKSTSTVAMLLILGAVCFTLGVISLTYAIRSLLWHRYMLQVAKPGPATSERDHWLREKA
jgi:predicted membrane channel-forming protein YqfA (hemolysin III family)